MRARGASCFIFLLFPLALTMRRPQPAAGRFAPAAPGRRVLAGLTLRRWAWSLRGGGSGEEERAVDLARMNYEIRCAPCRT